MPPDLRRLPYWGVGSRRERERTYQAVAEALGGASLTLSSSPMPSSDLSPPTRGVLLPPDRLLFSALARLLGISRSTLQRRYRPGTPDAKQHSYWRDRLDIRQRRVAERGAVHVVLHCSRSACEDLRRELLGGDSEDLPAA